MSGHAETIRRHAEYVQNDEVLAALDALLAEIQRLREALEACAVAALATDDAQRIAREALAGDTE